MDMKFWTYPRTRRVLVIPTAINGVVPNWSTVVLPAVLTEWQRGGIVTYNDGTYVYTLNVITSSELRLLGRFAFNYPSATKTRFFYISINRSTGAVTALTKDFTTS